MSTQSAKSARRSTKTARRTPEKTAKTASTAKKTAKSQRATASKAAKSARRPVAKATKATKPTKSAKTAKTAAKATLAPSLAPELAAAAAMIRTASPPMQPVAAQEMTPLRAHKYRVGETVYYTSPTFGRAAATGSYTVVRLLPSEGDDYQYRIKSSGEAFERVAKESQLDRA